MLSVRSEMKTIESAFFSWKNDYIQLKQKKRLNAKQAEKFILQKKLNIWKNEHKIAQRLALASKTAQELYETKAKQKSFSVFLEILEKGKALGNLEKAFSRKNNNLILKEYYQGWRNLYQNTIEIQRREKFEGLEIQGLTFNSWILYVKQCHEKKRKLALAKRQFNNSLEKLIKLSLKNWKKIVAKNQRRKQIEKLIGDKKKRRIYRHVFILLTEQRTLGIKENIEKISEAQEEVNVKRNDI